MTEDGAINRNDNDRDNNVYDKKSKAKATIDKGRAGDFPPSDCIETSRAVLSALGIGIALLTEVRKATLLAEQ